MAAEIAALVTLLTALAAAWLSVPAAATTVWTAAAVMAEA
jgi:hypothetical protein